MSGTLILGTDGTDLIENGYESSNGNSIDYDFGDFIVQAGRGNDTISTRYGDDTVYGGTGENVISTSYGDDVIYTGRHSTNVDAGYGRDSVYADLSTGADHTIDLGSWDYYSDMLHLENVSLDRASALTVNNFQTDEFSEYSDTLYIDGQLVDFTNLASGLSLSQDENRNAVLSFGDDDTVTFAGVSTNELLGIFPDYVLTGTSGDDYVDAAYVDEDGEMLAYVYNVELGDGNDFIELVDNHSWLYVTLGSGADTLSVDKSSVAIGDFAAEDTILIDGEKLTWALIDSKGYDTHDGDGYFSVQSHDDDFEIYSYSSISLVDYLGERGVIGQVDGTSGDDMILASYRDVEGEMVSDGADIVNAGDGNDVVKSYFGNDTVFGGDGDDSIYGDRGNNQLFGEAGNDVIGSGRHQSTLSGGDGDDLLIADMQKGGDHVLNGGDGMDTFDLRYAATSKVSDIVIQDFDPMYDSLVIDEQTIDLGALPEGAMLADNDNGTALLTLVTGDTVLLEGHSTNDLLGILEPNGEVNGTDMSDKIDRMFADKDGEMVGDTNDLVIGGGGRDTIYGYSGDDTIYGNSGKDELYGMTGHNHLFGGTGDDVIYSGRHSSVLDGGDGSDVLNADLSKGGDHVITGGKGLDVFNLTNASLTKEASTTLTDFNVEQDTLVIFDRIIDLQNLPDDMSISANDDGDAVLHFNDNETVTLQGISLDDLGMEPEKPTTVGIVDGTNGDDLIDDTYVDADGDMLTDGNDTIDAGAGDDEVITGRGSNVIYGGDGDDLLGSTRGSSELYGEAGDDVLVALRHTSLLDGGAGDDILAADLSKGADHTLTGGDGNDQFVLGRVSIEKASHITITDFDAANETLYIEEELVDFDDLVSGLSLSDNEDGNAVLTFGDDDTATFTGVSSQDLIDANPMADLFIPMTDDELAEEDADQVADIFLM